MRGADLLVQTLAGAGVRTIFSLSGNQIMPVYDACIDAGIRIVHTRHEAAAVFMADAWAQLTGSVGVALVTAAPGFGNALGALFTARASESPVLLLSGDAPLAQDGRGAFQELDQVAASTPLTKLSFRAVDALQIGEDMARAIRIARDGRPGPVHVALPFDILQGEAGGGKVPSSAAIEHSRAAASNDVVASVRAALAAAERPIVLTGPQLSRTRAGQLCEELGEAVGAPVITMESPRGLNDPALGKLAHALAAADLIVCLAKRVDFTLGFGAASKFAPQCRWIVVDPEEAERARAQRNLDGRMAQLLAADAAPLAAALINARCEHSGRQDWLQAVAGLVAARDFAAADRVPAGAITPLSLSRAVGHAMRMASHPLLVCDGGEFGQWAQAALPASDRLINGPSGAIGGGLCYALAARAARPEATVFALMGDGTIGFQLAEFETAVRENLPFVAVIGNDRCWNAEHQIQLREYGPHRLIGCQLSGARYDLAAAGLGAHGEHVERAEDLDGALHRAVASGLPACVNVEMVGLAAPVIGQH